jgi:hypothetical protein
VADWRDSSYPWIGFIASPLAAIASFVIAYFVDPLNFGEHDPLAAIPAFLLAVVVLMIGQNVAAYRELERMAGSTRETRELVRTHLDVTKVGSPEEGIRYVASRLPLLQEARNTSFNVHGYTERANDMFYDTEPYGELSNAIAKWSGRRVRWRDVGDEFAVERLRRISSVSRANGHASHHQYKLIAKREPQINFVVLGYLDGTSEVLFNWDFRSLSQDPVVLLSRDRDIVNMFTVQFEHLWIRAETDDKNLVGS